MPGRFREEGEAAPLYEPGDTRFTVEVHHGGFFVGAGVDRAYIDGKVTWFDGLDADFWSFLGIEEMILLLNYGLEGEKLQVYWLLPGMGLSDGLRIVSSDEDTVIMKQVSHKVKNLVLYFDHHNHVAGHNWEDIVANPIADLPKVMSPKKVHEVPKKQGEKLPEFYTSHGSERVVPVPESESDSDDSIEDPNFVDSDNEVGDGDDDLFFDNVDVEVTDQGAAKGKKVGKDKINKKNEATSTKKVNKEATDQWDELETDDELELPDADEEGDVRQNMTSFRPEDVTNPIFKIGMTFPTVEVLREAITEYSLKHRVEISMPRNDRGRIEAHCEKGCPWYMYASHDSRVDCFLVKRFVGEHNCQKKWVLKKCTAKWLAEKYIDSFRADEKMTLTNFARTVQLEWNLTPSRSKLSRARRMAMQAIYGDEVQQFNQLWDYAHELRRSNPGSSFYLNLNEGCFSTLYVSLDACKRGFLSGCRPIICLDGCHIKTKFGGQLLTAVGIDPNDCIFPIAMAVVEVESLVTWKWFLETLKEDLGIENTYPWTIMTDKQKGLIPAVQQVFHESEHRFCVRHLYSNFQVHFKGENLKNQLWACARSSSVQEWTANMEKMKALNSDAYDWLEKMPPNTWSGAFFSEFPKSDILLNNSCEVFNKYILDARELPILSMLQRIKSQLMTRHYNKQNEMKEKWTGTVCPKIRKKVAKNAEMANTCYALQAGQGVFQVMDREKQYNVDLVAKHCDCRRWDITGIPCSHAISCLRHERISQESVISDCYSLEAFGRAYSCNIWPCNDKTSWAHVEGPEILPPKYEKRIGRPPKSRRKAPHEVQGKNGPKLSKHGVIIHCRHCRNPGHNAATCEAKKAGLPPKMLPRRKPRPCHDEAWQEAVDEPIITQEMHPNISSSQPLMSQMSSTMVSQMMDEASQSRRQELREEPLPDCSFIASNRPIARAMPVTTATKAGSINKRKVGKEKGVATKKKKDGPSK